MIYKYKKKLKKEGYKEKKGDIIMSGIYILDSNNNLIELEDTYEKDEKARVALLEVIESGDIDIIKERMEDINMLSDYPWIDGLLSKYYLTDEVYDYLEECVKKEHPDYYKYDEENEDDEDENEDENEDDDDEDENEDNI